LQAGKNKRGYLVQLEAKRRLATKTMWSWQVDATPFFSSFSILPYLFFLLFVFFLHFFVFVSLFVFSLSNRSSVHLFSSPVRPCVSLLECPVSSAVASEDGALELLLMAKYNGLTLCFSLSFVRPLSLCVSLCSLFFSLYWFSCPWSLCFFFFVLLLSPPFLRVFGPLSSFFVHSLSLAFIRPENAMRSKLGNGMHYGGEE